MLSLLVLGEKKTDMKKNRIVKIWVIIVSFLVLFHIFQISLKFFKFFLTVVFFKNEFYLLIFIEGKGGGKRGRETSMCGCLQHTPC